MPRGISASRTPENESLLPGGAPPTVDILGPDGQVADRIAVPGRQVIDPAIGNCNFLEFFVSWQEMAAVYGGKLGARGQLLFGE